ncbi:cytochrome c oxidase subunit II [Aureimonas pseudogalii]|uniref:Cytochrome c oxidase subunit 2 n=1 Tax=Aureimonas pseudogalii TaxID=1744844 RepID=A0A7W6E855_9HYPH|nr:c-type cytochrome [Aureimonas pseudogalii]MBB3996516.1 cytochrome c oxidase subunit 2 [Aureimonas pseudogalii]
MPSAEGLTLTFCNRSRGPTRRRARLGFALIATATLAACQGPQSTFDPAGTEAARVLDLFWVMLAGATAIWLVVMGISVYATKAHPEAHSEKSGLRLILWGGVAFPVVVLTALLVFGLRMMPDFRAPADGPRIAVSGERFWWRVHYDTPDQPGVAKALSGEGVPSANEVWLPVGQRSEILLGSPDVIHSFWVPNIAGKTDTIPGRINRLVVEPTREGVYNGICAEFCGTAHAQMGFRVRVVSREAYAEKVAAEASPAAVLDHPGRAAFERNGCGACHQVRGTDSNGLVGPDLTHLAARQTLGAGILPVTPENIARFVAFTEHEKPGVQMPDFGMLPETELRDMAAWLGALR